MSQDHRVEQWPVRPLMLAALGLFAAVFVQQLTHVDAGPLSPERQAIAFGLAITAFVFGFTAEPRRLSWSVAFAAVMGIACAGIYYWNGPATADAGWVWLGWPIGSLCLGAVVATPLFQTVREEGAWRFPYARLHSHAWTNPVLWCACWLFVGIVFALAWLLATLFTLVKLDFLRELLGKDWFIAALLGTSFGGSLGLLRETDMVLRLLQRVVAAVLAVLAPVLAAGLIVFLVAVPLMGTQPLWNGRGDMTGTALACVFGALVLTNAVIGNGGEDGSRNLVLRVSALVLALTLLPLTFLAAFGLFRLVQTTGWTPGLLWTLMLVVLAAVYGVAYLVAVVRGRADWAARVRPANVHIALGVVVVAVVLATPLVGFDAIAARDQVARLQQAKITPDRFDWPALAFDYGQPGRAALAELARSKNPLISKRARAALDAKSRFEAYESAPIVPVEQRLKILPRGATLPDLLRKKLGDFEFCGNSDDTCTVITRPNATAALVIPDNCLNPDANKDAPIGWDSCFRLAVLSADGRWHTIDVVHQMPNDPATLKKLRDGLAAGRLEYRTVQRRQAFVDGVPIGDAFE